MDGAVDPMPQRIWKVDGDFDRLEIDPEDFTECVTKDGSQEYRTASRSNAGKTENTSQKDSDSQTKKKKVTQPADITGNSSRNRYFLHKVRERLLEQGQHFDRQPLVETLRGDLKKSKAQQSDIQRWSSDTYLIAEIENCIRFIQREGYQHNLFGLNTGPHELHEFSERFLRILPLTPGVLLVRSPMSSGKTFGLQKLLRSARRVLVITHRQSLARDLARRLDIFCYLDGKTKILNQDRMVICVNSLHRISYMDYDLVILEESEQLLRHLSGLTSIKEKPHINHESFERCVRQARQVLALDAQLSDLSVRTLEFIRPNERFSVWRNNFPCRKQLRMHGTKPELISAFERAVMERNRGTGKPVALVTNSKTIAHQQYERIRKDFPKLKCLVISSRTTGDAEIQALLKDFDSEGSQYDVILASPTMSTGVSIEQLDFRVFGVFAANINCHTDCAQAISRFRLAEQVDVFVAKGNSPTYRASQIVETRLKTLRDKDIYFANDGTTPSFRADLFLRVQAYEEQGKGLLRQNFLSLARESGWSVEFIGFSLDKMFTGGQLIATGREIEEQVRIENLQASERLTDSKLEEISSKNLPTSPELDAVERTHMERFYFRSISPELIIRDGRGSYRTGLRNLAMLQEDTNELIAEDRAVAMDMSALPLNFRSKGMARELLTLFLRAVGLPEDGQFDGFQMISGQLVLRKSPKPAGEAGIETVFVGWTKNSLNRDALEDIERRRLEIKAFLGRSVPHNFQKNPVGFINQILKECLAVPISSTRPRAGQGRAYHYTLQYSRLQILNADRLRRSQGLLGLIGIDDPEGDPF
jgi:hypothetical protein